MLRVVDPGRAAAVVDIRVAGFALDVRGRPRILARQDPAVHVTVGARRVALRAGGDAAVAVTARARPRASPGDHAALLLLSTRAPQQGGVAVRMQLGVIVLVRVPGEVVHRLSAGAIRVARRMICIALRNRGNVAERILPRELVVELRRAGRVVARLRARTQELLPHSAAMISVALPRTSRATRAVVTLRHGAAFVRRVVATGRAGRRSRRP
jgi:hypothetical protein